MNADVDERITLPTFNPAHHIGSGYVYDWERNTRSMNITQFDMSRVVLSTHWLHGCDKVSGELRRRRIMEHPTLLPLNCDHLQYLLEHQEIIPETWKEFSSITFDADSFCLQGSGLKYLVYLYFNNGRWCCRNHWRGDIFKSNIPSALYLSF